MRSSPFYTSTSRGCSHRWRRSRSDLLKRSRRAHERSYRWDREACVAVRNNVRLLRQNHLMRSMNTLTASEARANLYRLIDQAVESHQPVVITGRRANAVLLSAEDWQSIQETLYLLSVPGMRESIKEGMAEPIDGCAKELDW